MKSRFLIICLSLLSINYAMASNPPSEWIHGDTLILPRTKTSLGTSEYQGLPSKICVIVFSENFTSFGTSCLQGGSFTTFVFKSTTPPTLGPAMEIADTIKCPCEAYDAYVNAGWKRNGYNWETRVAYELIRDLPYTLKTIESTQGSVTKEYPCDGSWHPETTSSVHLDGESRCVTDKNLLEKQMYNCRFRINVLIFARVFASVKS